MRSDPAWLRECLVRWLARKPGPAMAVFLRDYERHHGPQERAALMADVRALSRKAPWPLASRAPSPSTRAPKSRATASMTAPG